ncbi:hypothetical protein HaLaN_28681 [Haematococcus lacustris]|uniref:Uncharacterized protein n=1 Tax=Haematococcus lacustris TaxID=44745 RepID=A0A6A0AAU7_HAELA|nr:hypothetical protein HaLaN_28681 [Haematococcus lacustris]
MLPSAPHALYCLPGPDARGTSSKTHGAGVPPGWATCGHERDGRVQRNADRVRPTHDRQPGRMRRGVGSAPGPQMGMAAAEAALTSFQEGAGQSVVQGPFPPGSVTTPSGTFPAILFGFISGDDRFYTFSTCFEGDAGHKVAEHTASWLQCSPHDDCLTSSSQLRCCACTLILAPTFGRRVLLAAGAPAWDSWLDLYEVGSQEDLNVCGGQYFPRSLENHPGGMGHSQHDLVGGPLAFSEGEWVRLLCWLLQASLLASTPGCGCGLLLRFGDGGKGSRGAVDVPGLGGGVKHISQDTMLGCHHAPGGPPAPQGHKAGP